MRISARRSTGLVLAALALMIAGDARAQSEKTDEVVAIDATKGRDLDATQTISVRIRNDVVPMRSVVVSLVSPGRLEYVLGVVPANDVREWVVDTRLLIGEFRLVASSGGRGTRVSRSIDVLNRAEVSWDLGLDFVRVKTIEIDPGP